MKTKQTHCNHCNRKCKPNNFCYWNFLYTAILRFCNVFRRNINILGLFSKLQIIFPLTLCKYLLYQFLKCQNMTWSMKKLHRTRIEYWIGQGPCAVYQLIKWRKCKVNLCADETDQVCFCTMAGRWTFNCLALCSTST